MEDAEEQWDILFYRFENIYFYVGISGPFKEKKIRMIFYLFL